MKDIQNQSDTISKNIDKLRNLPFCKTNVPLASYTYYRIGGPADFALFPSNEHELSYAYQFIQPIPLPKLIIGGGTNLLVSDRGFHGIVLFTHQVQQVESLGNHRFYISSGVELQWVVKEILLKNNYEGVGGLVGIPGTVGGALYMNAGTVNGYICEWAESVTVLTAQGQKEVKITPDLYGYRTQMFCSPNDLILSAIFKFKESNISQQPIYEHYLQRRKETQPEGYCCGSVFKNPPGKHAGRLIEECGLKGKRHGGATISPKHANFIINEANASFEDVLCLIQLAKDKVRAQFGIELEEEVRIVFEDGCRQQCPHRK